MNPEANYQTSIARIADLHRQADASRLAAKVARAPYAASSRRRWRMGRHPRPTIVGRFAA